MSDEWEFDFDLPCSKCGHSPTKWMRCTNYACDDGWIDMYEYDDPMLFDEGDMEPCQDCHGTGIVRWCGECGHELPPNEVKYDDELAAHWPDMSHVEPGNDVFPDAPIYGGPPNEPSTA